VGLCTNYPQGSKRDKGIRKSMTVDLETGEMTSQRPTGRDRGQKKHKSELCLQSGVGKSSPGGLVSTREERKKRKRVKKRRGTQQK